MNTHNLGEPNFTKLIGSNIRFERKKRHLTIEDLSEILGIAPGFLGLIERGQRGTSIGNLVKIANYFSLTLDELITRDIDNKDIAVSEIDDEYFTKKDTLVSLVSSLNSGEVDFITSTIKSLRKLSKNDSDFSYE